MKRKTIVQLISILVLTPYLTACNDNKDNDTAEVISPKRPNVLFIMADDLGYSDLGAFGGEIHTPNLDALANEGRILSDYHTAPTCSPTRSQLISGTDHHQAGIGAMAELTPEHLRDQAGYEGYLNNRSLSIAEVLRDNGYRTYISGKWHLGLTPETNAHAKGFDHSFTLLQGLDLHFKHAPSGYNRGATYTEDGKEVPISALPENFFSTDFYTDKLLQYLENDKKSDKPFFAYAAYTAPHWPIQAPQQYSDKYKGKYDVGYEIIRNNRIARQKQLGIIPENFQAAEPLDTTNIPNYPKWNELTAEQKAIEARKMEVYAGMVENLDYNIGRIVQYLKANGQYDNTLIFFVSDNGAEGFVRGGADNKLFDHSLAAVGTDQSYHYIGPRWAEVSAAPFHLWKDTAGEGATTAPALIKLPNQKQAQSHYHGFASVLDILPTVLDFAQINLPKDQYKGRKINNPTGYSWKATLENKQASIRPDNFSFADELHGSKYAKQGDWKIALQAKSNLGTGQWELYNLKNDRGERNNLASTHPEQVAKLVEVYNKYTQQNGVLEYQK
ncbi:arylsulfatase [Acinetobacter sp. Marseille-Q1618]|uniref:arylsulfatase n=1 Tax=Acinetobacter sp. Marseille-Q1618 TaxID=2697502 RepID=UPI00156F3B2B|nr:arylsulfatase [Acinetobacter sp. Marseille-Q1618]